MPDRPPNRRAEVDAEALAAVIAYHERSKHHGPGRYARSLGFLDWDAQPDPFRRFPGADRVALARRETADAPDSPDYRDLFVAGRVPARPLDHDFVARLLMDSLALSAWKQQGRARWSLRVNPSSGNLHPTEGYVLAPAIAGIGERPALYHYAPYLHALERRRELTGALWRELVAALAPARADALLLVGLSSIHWREAWKYGERAYRYCQHDVGQALVCVALAAAALGYEATLLDELGSAEVAALLGLVATARVEPEAPDLVLALHPRGTRVTALRLPAEALERCALQPWQGAPNALSSDHEDWDVIEAVERATTKPAAAGAAREFTPSWPPLVVGDDALSFRALVQARRSAVSMDGRSGLARDAFFQALRRTLAGHGEAPYAALGWSPRVHLALFVHRVGELDPGLYVLVRDPRDAAALRAAFDPGFAWETPDGCPPELPLFRLKTGDVRGLVAHASCDQAIAGDGCFSLGMLARFEGSLRDDGPWMYPRLFWECGVVGQALYLKAEALGLRATGIGCFYDDTVHAALGLSGRAWQSLYHFTLGVPVDDARITSEPPNDG
ncbi:MAG: SagB/ThcOx family dehydrogenase, partial [Myxococcales bacterium]|nr:SagB/ThcOx family dehydrogenase [Myxococcales bacterium]